MRSLKSLERMTSRLREDFVKFEVLVNLDNSDTQTSDAVNFYPLDKKVTYSAFGDPGLSRNTLIESATGEFVAILDGDDLWSENWLAMALGRARHNSEAIFHPEYVYFFFEEDFARHSYTSTPLPGAKSHFMQHVKETSGADPRLDNLWTCHSFGKKEIYIRHPFRANNRDLGKGIEDWSFNIATAISGVKHVPVEGTIHMIRVKESNSQNQTNFTSGLLPWIP